MVNNIFDINNPFLDGFFFGSKRKKKLAENAIIEAGWDSINEFYYLLELWGGRFEYENYEEVGFDPRFYEMTLFNDGNNCTIAWGGEVIPLEVISGNNYSRFGYYQNVQLADYVAKSYGRYIPDCPGNIGADAVMSFNNTKTMTPPIFQIRRYAEKLSKIQRAINACLTNMRGSTLVMCTEEQGDAIASAYRNADDGIPIIIKFADEDQGAYGRKPEIMFSPQTADLLKALQESYDKTISQFCMRYGINANSVINKLSGIGPEELKQTEEATRIALKTDYEARKDGIYRINKKFGSNINVKIAFTNNPYNDAVKDEGKEENTDGENI